MPSVSDNALEAYRQQGELTGSLADRIRSYEGIAPTEAILSYLAQTHLGELNYYPDAIRLNLVTPA